MNQTKLSKFQPSLQIQLFLTSLFRLHTLLYSTNSNLTSSVLIKMEDPDSPWIENLGILHQLKLHIEHLLRLEFNEHLHHLHAAIGLAIEECKVSEIKDTLATMSWPNTLFTLTAQFLGSCPPDENLYYFLLRYQDECKQTFGRVFLLNLFKQQHSEGLHQTEKFLLDRFRKRGFSHLTTMIQKYLTGLAQC